MEQILAAKEMLESWTELFFPGPMESQNHPHQPEEQVPKFQSLNPAHGLELYWRVGDKTISFEHESGYLEQNRSMHFSHSERAVLGS